MARSQIFNGVEVRYGYAYAFPVLSCGVITKTPVYKLEDVCKLVGGSVQELRSSPYRFPVTISPVWFDDLAVALGNTEMAVTGINLLKAHATSN